LSYTRNAHRKHRFYMGVCRSTQAAGEQPTGRRHRLARELQLGRRHAAQGNGAEMPTITVPFLSRWIEERNGSSPEPG
jgi:hypothetical protein